MRGEKVPIYPDLKTESTQRAFVAEGKNRERFTAGEMMVCYVIVSSRHCELAREKFDASI
jgi:hypothetical protein